MSRDIKSWLDEYEESHRNELNVLFHNICVPLITWCVVSFLYHVEVMPDLNLAILGIIFASIFYLRLSLSRGLVMILMLIFFYATVVELSVNSWLLPVTAAIFVISWVMQFVGHKIEGKKPSLFKDLIFLLIGPLWVVEKAIKRIKN